MSDELSIFSAVYGVDRSVGGLERLHHLLLPGGWRSDEGNSQMGQLSMFKSIRHFNDRVLQINGTI